MKIKILYLTPFLLLILCSQCPPPSTVDSTGPQEITNQAEKFLYGYPVFFIPPYPDDPLADPSKKNITTAVAWTPAALTGPLINNQLNFETKTRYIDKLNLATVGGQTSWNQYQEPSQPNGSGFPGYQEYDNGPQHPGAEYQAGFVCYELVRRAVNDAGYDSWEGAIFYSGAGGLSYDCTEITDLNSANIGDIVLFDWEDDGTRDHAGIIVEKIGDGSNIKNWKIVSSIGIVEIFEGGANKTRLGVFGTTTNGGQFTYWSQAWNDWTFKVYRVPTN